MSWLPGGGVNPEIVDEFGLSVAFETNLSRCLAPYALVETNGDNVLKIAMRIAADLWNGRTDGYVEVNRREVREQATRLAEHVYHFNLTYPRRH